MLRFIAALLLLSPTAAGDAVSARCGENKTQQQLRAGDLSGCAFTIAIIFNDPFAFERDTGDEAGFFPDVVSELSLLAGFDYTLVEPDLSACTPSVNSSNYGCGHENVATGVADMIFADLYATSARGNTTLMTQPTIAHTGLALITRQKRSRASLSLIDKVFLVFQPFHFWVWVLIMFVFVPAVGGLFWVLEASESAGDFGGIVAFDGNMESYSSGTVLDGVLHTYFLAFSTLTGAHAHTPQTRPGKMLSISWQFFCVVVVAAYTAELAAYLSIDSDMEAVFSNFDKLESTSATVCTKGIGNVAYASWLATYRSAVKQLAGSYTSDEMVDAFVAGECDAIIDAQVHLSVLLHEYKQCESGRGTGVLGNAVLVGDGIEDGDQNFVGFVTPSLAGVEAALSSHLMAMTADGTLKDLKEKWLPSVDCELDDEAAVSLEAAEMSGLFILMCLVMVLLFLVQVYLNSSDMREAWCAIQASRHPNKPHEGALPHFLRSLKDENEKPRFTVEDDGSVKHRNAEKIALSFEEDADLRLQLVAQVATHLRLRDTAAAEAWMAACKLTAHQDEALKRELAGVEQGKRKTSIDKANGDIMLLYLTPAVREAHFQQRAILMRALTMERYAEKNRRLQSSLDEDEKGSQSTSSLEQSSLDEKIMGKMVHAVIELFHKCKLLHAVEEVSKLCRNPDGEEFNDKMLFRLYTRVRLDFCDCFRNALVTHFGLDVQMDQLRHDEHAALRGRQDDIREALTKFRSNSVEWETFMLTLCEAFNVIDTEVGEKNKASETDKDGQNPALKTLTLSDVAWGLTLVDSFFNGRDTIMRPHLPPPTLVQKRYEELANELKDEEATGRHVCGEEFNVRTVRTIVANEENQGWGDKWLKDDKGLKKDEVTIMVEEE